MMNRTKGKEIQAAALAALASVEERFGVKVAFKAGQIGDTYINLKFEFAEVGANGAAESAEAVEFKKYAHLIGLKPEDLGRSFQSNGHTFTIAGMSLGRGRLPVMVTREDGMRFKYGRDTVRLALGYSPAASVYSANVPVAKEGIVLKPAGRTS